MKVEFKLYKTFDADLISLHDNGINICDLMKMSLQYFSTGKVLYYIVPKCLPYNMTGHKRYIHLAMEVTDKKSVEFLKTQIKPRQRSAFLKTIVRTGLISPQVGPYLKHTKRIDEESDRIAEIMQGEPEYLENFTILEFSDAFVRHSRKVTDYSGASENTKQARRKNTGARKENKDYSNKFGDVSDLAPKRIKKDDVKIKEKDDNKKQNISEETFELDNHPFDKEEETNDVNKVEKHDNIDVTDDANDPFAAFEGLLGDY